jgi:hypothetical protein
MENRAVDLWTMRLRRNGSLAVENPGGFPTARAFAHSLHSGSYQCFKKPRSNPGLSTRVGNFQCPQLGKFECPLTEESSGCVIRESS